MKRQIRIFTSGMRSALFLTVLGCLLAVGLAGLVLQPASAARMALTDLGAQSGAAPQNYVPQIQELSAAQPQTGTKAQDRLHGEPIEGGSVLEFRDGQAVCRPATEEETRTMRRDAGQQFRVIGDDVFAPGSSQQEKKGLKIILRGTQQLEQFPQAKAAFQRAARAWENLIQNPITVVIDVDFGPTAFGAPFKQDQYGLTNFQRARGINAYPVIRSALIRSAGSPQEAAIYNSLPEAQAPTDLGASTAVIYHAPAMRALGLLPAVADPNADLETMGPPPSIGFNSDIGFDFDPSDGVGAKRYDFVSSAMHEIGHALGFFSAVGLTESHPEALLAPEMLDIFRFRPGVTSETFGASLRILSSGGQHVFFGGGPELPLSTARGDGTGGDGQQAGHWKNDLLTGRYIGIMDPNFSWGTPYEMTENDREAFETIGYRTNPLPDRLTAELKLDDGTTENGAIYDGLMVVNRLTPPRYPATLRKLRILIPAYQNRPDPVGKPITLIYAAGDSNGQPPSGAQYTRIATTVPSASADLFLEFTIPNGPTINSGDFYVGYQAPSPYQGVAFAVDLSGSGENRSFYSTNNGESYAPLAQVFQGKPTSAMIRAIVSVGGPPPKPTPTPTPTPGPATVALTSGVPDVGSMVNWAPYGWKSETQYSIQAPSGATQLKVELNANTDVDLYGRFGSRVKVENGAYVADLTSVSYSRQESITLTPTNSPALQAGVYYFMIVNYGPGPSSFTITATVTGSNPSTGKVASVSAANYDGAALASEQIVAAFGANLATTTKAAPEDQPLPVELAGTRVSVKDKWGTERAALLFFVSPNQVNYQIPPYTDIGLATVTVISGDGSVSVGEMQIVNVAPGLFTANADGQGAPMAFILRFKDGKPVEDIERPYQYDSAQRRFVTRPLDLGKETDQVFLILFGTGIRHNLDLSAVSVKIGGLEAPVYYAGYAPGYVGLDQINVLLPRSLIGRGEIDVAMTVDGRPANKVKINIK